MKYKQWREIVWEILTPCGCILTKNVCELLIKNITLKKILAPTFCRGMVLFELGLGLHI